MRNQHKYLNLTIVVLCLCFPFKSQAQNTILWEIKNTDNETRAYLIGTFHQMGNSFIDSIPKIKELLYSSDIAFFETIDPTDSLRAMLNRREESSEWKNELRKSDVKFLETHSEDWSVSINKLTPIELNIKLSQDYMLYTCGTVQPEDEWDHFDKYLIHLAKKKGIQIQGLETDNIQTKDINEMASSYDWKNARRDVKDIVRSIKRSKTNTTRCEFARQYMNFNFDYQFDEGCRSPNMIRRNNLWLPILLKTLESQKIFIAVGLRHLYGKCGLIEQFRRKGYKVEPIEIEKKPSP